MKVYEIIAESKRLDELGLVSRGLSKVLGPAVEVGANLFGKGPKGQALEKLANYIAHGGTVRDLAHARTIAGRNAKYVTDDFIKNAEKLAARKVRVANWDTNIAGLKGSLKTGAKVVLTSIRVLMTIGYYYMFYEPLELYLDNISVAQEKLASGEWTQKEFNDYRQREMSGLIGKWTALWAGGKMIKLPFAAAGKMFGMISPKLGAAMSGLGTAGQLYFMNWINNPENSETIASFMAMPLLTDTLGGIGVAAEDKIRSVIPFAKEIDSGQGSDPDTAPEGDNDNADPNAKADKDATSTQPDNADKTPSADASDGGTWTPVPGKPDYVINSKTGYVDFASSHQPKSK